MQSNFRLLVVRLGAMGDILHALPAVTALRLAHPEWVIDWVVEPRWTALLRADDRRSAGRRLHDASERTEGRNSGEHSSRDRTQPLVDRIYLAPVKGWARSPLSTRTVGEIGRLRREFRSAEYDAVLDFQGAVRSAALGRLAGSARIIGEALPREPMARWIFNERVATSGVHVIEQDLELAAAVAGDVLQFIEPWLPVDEAAESWCDGLLESKHEPRTDAPIALVNPGAGWGAKRWPLERYAEVADGLLKRGFRVFVNAGPGEEPLADFMVRETRGAAKGLVCTLGQLIALTRRIALAVAGDTGPLHLACALSRPVIGIFGPTDPSRNGPFGTRFRVLRSPHSLRDHSRRSTPESGMLTITPEDVLRAAEELKQEEQEAAR